MFAAATREVVFSNPNVVDRVNKNFIPVALKAAQVNRPPPGIEGKLYAEIGRSKPAPQGICTINSDGKVLAWALSFDKDDNIAEFLDYVVDRYRNSSTKESVTAERFMRFPSRKLTDVADNGVHLEIPSEHGSADLCPAAPRLARGTLVGRIIGRALDADGRPITDVVHQEYYMESRLTVAPETQQQLADDVEKANGKKFPIPMQLTRVLVGNAYLGQLDVDPSGRIPGTKNVARFLDFHGVQKESGKTNTIRIQIEGTSNLEGSHDLLGKRTDGRNWEHRVTLNWFGYVDIQDDQITRLTMMAAGDERFRWTLPGPTFPDNSRAQHLMAGHSIDLDCGVRYGVYAELKTAD